MDWVKKHAEAIGIIIAIISAIFTSMVWINSKFNTIEKDILVIKTVLVMKNIMPMEIARADVETKEEIEKRLGFVSVWDPELQEKMKRAKEK